MLLSERFTFMRRVLVELPFKSRANKKVGQTFMSAPLFCSVLKKDLSRQRPLKNRLALSTEGRARTPQRIALRITMSMRVRKPIRMADTDVPVAIAIRRRVLRQSRRITDRAESDRRCMNVIADGLQPLQYGLPLFPIQLPQERPQSLDERIFQQRFAVGFRDEEAVQADAQRLGDLLQRAKARRHLPAFDTRQIRARDFRARLQLALGHRARFAQLANALADILDRLLVDELFCCGFSDCFLRRCRWRNQELQTLRQGAHATAAIPSARPVLNETTRLTANDFPIHF